jgi:acylphosphatase
VTGFVRNLGDGRVEVVVEGAADEIRELLDRIEEHLGHYVRHVEQEKSAATGEFNGFEIRF